MVQVDLSPAERPMLWAFAREMRGLEIPGTAGYLFRNGTKSCHSKFTEG